MRNSGHHSREALAVGRFGRLVPDVDVPLQMLAARVRSLTARLVTDERTLPGQVRQVSGGVSCQMLYHSQLGKYCIIENISVSGADSDSRENDIENTRHTIKKCHGNHSYRQ